MFEFASPWLFLLLPLPWFVQRFVPAAKTPQQAALRIPFFQTIAQLKYQQTTSITQFTFYRIIAYLIWILLVIAAAGPQWLGDPINLPRQGRDILLAVDISGSMQTPDMILQNRSATRLDVVKNVAANFIQRRTGDRLGLILFGTRAYLQTPLTFDRATVQTMLDDATVGLAGPQTAIGDAIGLAVKKMQQIKNSKSRVLILLTDGSNNSGIISPIHAAELAAAAGIRIYTIGMGAEQLLIQNIFGTQMINPSADLDIEGLQTIAKLTGGLFFRAKDLHGLQAIYQQLDKLEPINKEDAVYRPITPLYPWLLCSALLLSLFLGWKHLPSKQKSIAVNKETTDAA